MYQRVCLIPFRDKVGDLGIICGLCAVTGEGGGEGAGAAAENQTYHGHNQDQTPLRNGKGGSGQPNDLLAELGGCGYDVTTWLATRACGGVEQPGGATGYIGSQPGTSGGLNEVVRGRGTGSLISDQRVLEKDIDGCFA